MFWYLLKRLVLAVPTILVVAIFTFLLSKGVPGDPVEKVCGNPYQSESGHVDFDFADREYCRCASKLHLDLPVFYFSIRPAVLPDTLHRICKPDHKKTLKMLGLHHGQWNAVSNYFSALKNVRATVPNADSSLEVQDVLINVRRNLDLLFVIFEAGQLQGVFDELRRDYNSLGLLPFSKSPEFSSAFSRFEAAYQAMTGQQNTWKKWIPAFHWYGLKNQFHYWFSGFFSGNMGRSLTDDQAISSKIGRALGWTLLLNGVAITMIFFIAVPLGVQMAINRGSRFDRWMGTILFVLFSAPVFWIATLLVVFFTTAEYSPWLDWFPSIGLRSLPETASSWAKFWDVFSHLILPIVCLTYPGLALLNRHVRGSMLTQLEQDYVRTARAKGLSEKSIVWRHAFRLASFPMITIIAGIIPGMFAGSLVVEFIFNIPGMGRLLYNAIFDSDWPLLFAAFLIFAFLTILGQIIGDILYKVADPRVAYD